MRRTPNPCRDVEGAVPDDGGDGYVRSFVLQLLDVDHLRDGLQSGLCKGGTDHCWNTGTHAHIHRSGNAIRDYLNIQIIIEEYRGRSTFKYVSLDLNVVNKDI